MGKIAITTTSFGVYDNGPLKLCKENGFDVVLNPYGRKVKSEELINLAKNALGLIAGTELIKEEVLLELTSLKAISRCGAGLDNIELDAAKRLGIKIFNTPDAPTIAVAELTIGLILDLLRKVSQMDRDMRNNQWQKRMGNLLQGKKVGIKGFGRIGKKVAELLGPFGCEIAYADPYVENRLLGLNRLSFDELLDWADIITIHVSVSEKLIGEKEFESMKKGAFIVNTSRGGVIDELALYKYLANDYLSGAALDVFEEEPYIGPLKELDNIILTPHIGSYAKEARIEMERQAVENLLRGLSDED